MKRKFILTASLTALIVLNCSATIWRVNNAGFPADFTAIQAAHDSASVVAGDTLHLEPSAFNYGSLVSTKKLIVFGPGYFLNQNPGQQANPATASITDLTLSSGSDGTTISGLSITGSVLIEAGNITISRNNIAGVVNLSRDYTYSNILISANYMNSRIDHYGLLSTPVITNVLIINNYLDYIYLSTQYSGVLANNVFANYISTISYFQIKNNIFTHTANLPSFSGSFNIINNNISASPSGLPAGNGNQNGVSMPAVFVGPIGNSTDGQWQLAAGSPAIGAGMNGDDCGMYGSNSPYRLSGLPVIPSIYYLSAPANSNGNTLPVVISVKSNN